MNNHIVFIDNKVEDLLVAIIDHNGVVSVILVPFKSPGGLIAKPGNHADVVDGQRMQGVAGVGNAVFAVRDNSGHLKYTRGMAWLVWIPRNIKQSLWNRTLSI